MCDDCDCNCDCSCDCCNACDCDCNGCDLCGCDQRTESYTCCNCDISLCVCVWSSITHCCGFVAEMCEACPNSCDTRTKVQDNAVAAPPSPVAVPYVHLQSFSPHAVITVDVPLVQKPPSPLV
ncbi:hypothetical protein SPRG_21276 [Saprolegnia parasitica CBS 223.65]|uniref:Uncharacterized protein n=1 Tax=Saprolegnia parasitica (strain CBS 223.65) TaxID=695850 RepID=A0A067BXP5_SAPPC|nr:hypothetical protein SPRG_21276 [Saprolegnia parasitica CBS 223.65]KDO21615.1 hypothetical protein SPRG_21276 [Saprolegnia parasitica CBS 223.65]|eukprot:XP_012207708.1 hypothetical protein SPRG_21276 [Saprolegnia parasitica CBS 223.65]